MSVVVDRYERLATGQLRDLRKLQRMAMNRNTDSASIRDQMSWQRMSVVVDRYERLATGQLRDLRKLQRMAMNRNTDSASIRDQIDRIGQNLQSSLTQLLGERENLDAEGRDQFDTRVESIRKQIQAAIQATTSLPPLESKNPFEEPSEDESNPYELEGRRFEFCLYFCLHSGLAL
ncbi:unnamed protein product [Cylicostephanus goldi]|uniref:STX17-like N-terminal domain-containing protein n=1 Tax=Cylicostephanus goldi TaxID=71465 RepID=A0A3P7MW74_CYLGO|nr:unnamed protein product [Cylicostephanus goldi]